MKKINLEVDTSKNYCTEYQIYLISYLTLIFFTVTETLQYPDFSCVVTYKRLIVGFAFLVPNVSHTENYISFIFTRPGWRNIGIATFMLYHLIQVNFSSNNFKFS